MTCSDRIHNDERKSTVEFVFFDANYRLQICWCQTDNQWCQTRLIDAMMLSIVKCMKCKETEL